MKTNKTQTKKTNYVQESMPEATPSKVNVVPGTPAQGTQTTAHCDTLGSGKAANYFQLVRRKVINHMIDALNMTTERLLAEQKQANELWDAVHKAFPGIGELYATVLVARLMTTNNSK